MKKSLFGKLGVVAAALSLSACATLFTGTKDTVTFNSTPAGATVLIDGIEVGRTPTTIPLKRPGLSSKTVTLRMQGYQDRTFELQKSFNTVSVLNLTNLFAWGIDALSGAIYKVDPKTYDMTLERRTAAAELNVDHVALITELERTKTGTIVLPQGAESMAVVDPFSKQVIVIR
jgi:hypothetical protein